MNAKLSIHLWSSMEFCSWDNRDNSWTGIDDLQKSLPKPFCDYSFIYQCLLFKLFSSSQNLFFAFLWHAGMSLPEERIPELTGSTDATLFTTSICFLLNFQKWNIFKDHNLQRLVLQIAVQMQLRIIWRVFKGVFN